MDDFLAKLAPQLLANLPVAYGRGWPSGAPIDPKQPLTLKLREMGSGVERPVQFDVAGEVLIGDLRRVAHRRFPVVLARKEACGTFLINREPKYSTLNSRIHIIRTPK